MDNLISQKTSWNVDAVYTAGIIGWEQKYGDEPDSDTLELDLLEPALHCLHALESVGSPKPNFVIGYDSLLLTLTFEGHISLMQTLEQRNTHRWHLLLMESNEEYDMDDPKHVDKVVSLLTTRTFFPPK